MNKQTTSGDLTDLVEMAPLSLRVQGIGMQQMTTGPCLGERIERFATRYDQN